MTSGHFTIAEKNFREWEKEHGIKKDWLTSEGIPVKSVLCKRGSGRNGAS